MLMSPRSTFQNCGIFVDAQFAEPFADRINPLVAVARLARDLLVVGMHGAKFVNLELTVLHPGTRLHVKERPGRLESLRDPDDDGEQREKRTT